MKKIFLFITIITCAGLLFTSCEDVLDKENLSAINPDDVWSNESMANAYLNGIYGALMPGMPLGTGNYTDEAVSGISAFAYGTATIDSYNNWPYGTIRTINFLLENINSGSLTDEQKDPIIGQGLFWRAWTYFDMVKAYGGVPLVLPVQDPADKEVLKVKRNKTSQCITQIIEDLDNAIAKLPSSWNNANTGRIDKCAAKAFKSKVLLFYASPQFNPENIASRWQNAYNAAKEAKEYCESQGKGLYESFSGIWDDELNTEVIMVRRYNNPGSTYFSGGVRPLVYSNGATGQDQPSLELVEAFPLIDGTPWNPGTMSFDTIYRHRDERFYATIAYNGANPYLKDMFDANTRLWTYRRPDGGAMDGPLPTLTSFYRVKGLDKTIDISAVELTSTDWPEIRFAEVLMIYGEAANEIGKSDEALQVLYNIRKRAGIKAGSDGKYGITASTQAEIRTAFMNENYLEFAFEGKRWDQLRRLRQLDVRLNSLKHRHGLIITLKEGETGPTGMDNVDNYLNRFNITKVETETIEFDVKDEYYFYGIPKTHLDQNPDLEQTSGWDGGTFDPLL